MKKLLLPFLLTLGTLVFAGCMETTEELTIAADGSGTYQVGVDLSGLFDLMAMMQAMDTSTAGKKQEKLDTVMAMRSFADTASHLTAEQKALLQNAKMKMKMDEAAREFKMDMNFPFTKIGDVEKLMAFSQSSGGGSMMENIFKGAPMAGEAGKEGMPDINSYFDMTVTGNVIERRLNKEKYATLQNDVQTQNLQQAGDMLETIKFNTVINLPRPAKKITGSHATLSADKKTLTLKGTLQDLFSNPEAFSYRVEY